VGKATWLEEAQDLMLDFERLQRADSLTRKLYSTVDAGKPRIFDKDARAFAQA
jgi:hypothetical protein